MMGYRKIKYVDLFPENWIKDSAIFENDKIMQK